MELHKALDELDENIDGLDSSSTSEISTKEVDIEVCESLTNQTHTCMSIETSTGLHTDLGNGIEIS